MTTQSTTLNRIISELKELNEFDGETVEFILKEIGYNDYALRHLIMTEPMESIEHAYDERIQYDKDNNTETKHPLVHRLEMIQDDMSEINSFIEKENLGKFFNMPSRTANSCNAHFHNIEIACDLGDNEVHNWGKFNGIREIPKTEENPEQESLKTDWREIRNLNIEAKRLGEIVWHENTKYTRKQFLLYYKVRTIPLILILHEVWNDIENNDTLIYNNFEDYWKYFVENQNKSVSL